MLLANASVCVYFKFRIWWGWGFSLLLFILFCHFYGFGVVCFLLCRMYGWFINLRLVSDFFVLGMDILDLLIGCCVIEEDLFCARIRND